MTSRISRRFIAWATSILIGLGVVLLATTAILFVNLRDRQQAVLESVREDAMWAVFQTHREASRLIEAIHVAQASPSAQNLATVSLFFDLLYSRITLLDGGFFADRFRESKDLSDVAQAVQGDILALTEVIDPLLGDDAALFAALPHLLEDSTRIQVLSNEMVLLTNERLGAARAEDRLRTSQDYGRLAWIVAATALVFVGTIALQFIQVRMISHTQQQLRDLSLKHAESAKAAQAASEAKTMFLATMSHEIRTPLNGIIGAVDLLYETNLSTEQAKRALTIRRSGHILLDVINDILDFSNLDANGVTYQTSSVSLPEMADILGDMFRQRLKDAGLRMEFTGPHIAVATDDVRLRQVLLNLIGNAIKFTPSGKITVRASLPATNRLRIDVTDTGIGIPQDDLPKLFQNFSQIEGSASRRFGGTGLGLAICKRIITGMGGTMGVESVLGEGSTFWLELPVEVLGDVSEVTVKGSASDAAALASKFQCRILLAEDNVINRDVARALLESFGAMVTVAEDGQATLEKLEHDAFDLLITDLQMPVMDGITATQELRARGHKLPVVGLTANAYPEDRKRCLDAGMNSFVAKPVTRSKIASILAEFAEPAADAQPSEPLIDLDQLHPILDDVGAALFLELLEQLAQDGRALLDVDTKDGLAFDAALHSLKGAAATLGLCDVAQRAQALRDAAQPEQEALTELVSKLNESIDQAKFAVDGPDQYDAAS